MILTSVLADIASSDEVGSDFSTEYAAAAETVDPRELPDWAVDLAPPEPRELEGLSAEEAQAAKLKYGPGPVSKILMMCMPTRAGAAARMGSLEGVHPDAQLLKSLVYVGQCHCFDAKRRRFLFQDKEGLECLLLDVGDPVRRCPAQVPHGPEGRRAAATRALGKDFSEEALEQVLAGDEQNKTWSEADEQQAREDAPLLTVRYEHVLKGLPDTHDRIVQAREAAEDGFGMAPGVGFTAIMAESAAEIRAAVTMLERHASLLTPEYKDHFANLSPNHAKPGDAKGYLPSFLVAPPQVLERAPNTPCGNPDCGNTEEPLLKAAMAMAQKNPGAVNATSLDEVRAAGQKFAMAAKQSRFMICAACKSVSYCSKECQKAHWANGHKLFCASEKARRQVITEEIAKAAQAQQANSQAPGQRPSSTGGKNKAKGGNKKKGRGKREKA